MTAKSKRKKIVIGPDQLSGVQLLRLPEDSFESHEELKGYSAEQLFLEGQTWENLSIEYCRFNGSRFLACDFVRSDIEQSVFLNSDFANTSMERILLNHVAFVRSRLTGFNGSFAHIKNSRFEDCKATLASFWHAKLTNCEFIDCNLKGANFHHATLKNVRFRDCDLSDARFAQASLESVDMRSSGIGGIVMGQDSMKGLTIEPQQSIVFAELLGLRVEPLVSD